MPAEVLQALRRVAADRTAEIIPDHAHASNSIMPANNPAATNEAKGKVGDGKGDGDTKPKVRPQAAKVKVSQHPSQDYTRNPVFAINFRSLSLNLISYLFNRILISKYQIPNML